MKRSKATQKANTTMPGKLKKDEEEELPEGEKNFDDKQSAVFPSGLKGQASFEKNVSSEQVRNGKG